MKLKYILLIYIFFASIYSASAQKIKRSEIRKTYSYTSGRAGQKIIREDGSHTNILPVTDSKTSLKIKVFGRAKIKTEEYRFEFSYSRKAKWMLNADTLCIMNKNDCIGELFLIDNSRDPIIYLISLDGKTSYYQETERFRKTLKRLYHEIHMGIIAMEYSLRKLFQEP